MRFHSLRICEFIQPMFHPDGTRRTLPAGASISIDRRGVGVCLLPSRANARPSTTMYTMCERALASSRDAGHGQSLHIAVAAGGRLTARVPTVSPFNDRRPCNRSPASRLGTQWVPSVATSWRVVGSWFFNGRKRSTLFHKNSYFYKKHLTVTTLSFTRTAPHV